MGHHHSAGATRRPRRILKQRQFAPTRIIRRRGHRMKFVEGICGDPPKLTQLRYFRAQTLNARQKRQRGKPNCRDRIACDADKACFGPLGIRRIHGNRNDATNGATKKRFKKGEPCWVHQKRSLAPPCTRRNQRGDASSVLRQLSKRHSCGFVLAILQIYVGSLMRPRLGHGQHEFTQSANVPCSRSLRHVDYKHLPWSATRRHVSPAGPGLD